MGAGPVSLEEEDHISYYDRADDVFAPRHYLTDEDSGEDVLKDVRAKGE
jgi:hypothetical protein